MTAITLIYLLCFQRAENQPSISKPTQQTLIRETTESGRCVTLGESSDARVKKTRLIAPGQPPVLTFRYYEGKLHHRFNNSDLTLDDAGH